MSKPTPHIHQPHPAEPIDPTSWSATPPDDDPCINYRLIRTKTGKPQGMIILSTDWIGTATHYWQGRTRKCDPTGCEACGAGNAARWHGFLAVQSATTKEIAILEVPKSTVHQVNHHRITLKSIRGKYITVQRVPDKPNGTVHAVLLDPKDEPTTLPPEPNVREILDRMWDQSRLKSRKEND